MPAENVSGEGGSTLFRRIGRSSSRPGRSRRNGEGNAAVGLLRAAGIKIHFEGVRAVDGVDVSLQRGEILGVIGPNGAGKTTLVNAITGLVQLTEGSISLRGEDVTGWPSFRLARAGMSRTFQSARAFGGLTALENVQVGGVAGGLGRRAARARGQELLEMVHLESAAETPSSMLSHGQERRLEIARAVALAPDFLFLDEPAAGLNEGETDELVALIKRLGAELDAGVLVIEHDMRMIMPLCDRIQVLNYGCTISIGTPDEVRSDPSVIEAYLGQESQDA